MIAELSRRASYDYVIVFIGDVKLVFTTGDDRTLKLDDINVGDESYSACKIIAAANETTICDECGLLHQMPANESQLCESACCSC